MVDIRKIGVNSETFLKLEEENFFKKMDTAEVVNEICHMEGVSIYVAADDDEIIGYALAEITKEKIVEILSISVSENYRNSGVGCSLIKFVFNDLKPKAMVAKVLEDSIGFFEKVGFYGIELGESLNGMEAFYVTYRE